MAIRRGEHSVAAISSSSVARRLRTRAIVATRSTIFNYLISSPFEGAAARSKRTNETELEPTRYA